MSNLGSLRRTGGSRRSQVHRLTRRLNYNVRDINGNNAPIQKPDPKTIFIQSIKYFLNNKNALMTFDLTDILPEKLIKDKTIVYNKNYDDIDIKFISLYYSVQNKCYMWLGLNDNVIYILYADKELEKLPFINKINAKDMIEKRPERIAYDVFVDSKKRRLMSDSFDKVFDLTIKPYQVLKLKDII